MVVSPSAAAHLARASMSQLTEGGDIPLPEVEVEVFDDGRRSRWRASAPARRGHWELSSGHGLELVRDDLLGAPPPLTGPGSH